jgi:hypothetical protein
VDCGTPPAAPVHGTVSFTTTTYGSTATYGCDAGYQMSGGASITCQVSASWSGGAPTCEASYCDVVYQITGTFRVSDAPQACGNVTNTVSTNGSTPSLESGATTPFTAASEFNGGFIRLRFPDGGGQPITGAVGLVEYYLPIEFELTACAFVDLITNVDHSVGLLALTGSPPTIPSSPQLWRPCQSWANGSLTNTTLTWGTCSAQPTAGDMGWSADNAVAGAGDTGCALRMSVWGHVGCSGLGCFAVPGRGNQRATWDQFLNSFAFSQSTDLTTATFTMAEVQIPEGTNEGNTRTWVAITSATPIHHQCGPVTAMTCDDEAP